MPQTGEKGQSTLSLFMRNDSSESHRGEGGALQHPPEGTSQAAPFTAASLTAVLPESKTAATAARPPSLASTDRHRGRAGHLLPLSSVPPARPSGRSHRQPHLR